MRPRVDLHLIDKSLRQLRDSTYFEKRLNEFTDRLSGAINHVLSSPGAYDPAIVAQFSDIMLHVQSYLAGSTNNEIPFEVVYCLRDALRRWMPSDAAIVTHITEAHNFHLAPIAPWEFITKALTGFDVGGYHLSIVMIGVPRIYAHKPIFCVPLYHELGHFVDMSCQISEISALIWNKRLSPIGSIELSHRREYFADLFAATFVGRSSVAALEAIAPDAITSATHPSTADRARVVDDFLTGTSNPIVDLFQRALAVRGMKPLAAVYTDVDVTEAFDDLRTFTPSTIEQVHGMFDASWRYLFDCIDGPRNPWDLDPISDGDRESIANDLIEKSIRNFAIRSTWNVASAAP